MHADLRGARRAGIVGLGYAVAIAAGVLAGWAYDVRVSAEPYDTSGGMYAAGQAFAVLGTFLVLATVPTFLALWYLRESVVVWTGVAIAALGFALAGLAGASSAVFIPEPGTTLLGVGLELLALGQWFGVPVWLAVFLALMLLAPTGSIRRMFGAAVAIEGIAAIFVAIHWLSASAL